MGRKYYYKMSVPFAVDLGNGETYKLQLGDIIEHIEGNSYKHSKTVLEIKPERIKEYFRQMLTQEDTYWQSVRNQAAIAIMQAALSNDCLREAVANNGKENGIKAFDNIIEFAVSGAIGLVEKLKKEE